MMEGLSYDANIIIEKTLYRKPLYRKLRAGDKCCVELKDSG